jgi:hypothetical protein
VALELGHHPTWCNHEVIDLQKPQRVYFLCDFG